MKNKRQKRTNGFVLLAVMMIAIFGMMFLMATATALISVLQSESAVKVKSNLLSAALIGRNYALLLVNQDPAGVTPSLFELPQALCPYDSIAVAGSVRFLTDSECLSICSSAGITEGTTNYDQVANTLVIDVRASTASGSFSRSIRSLAARGTKSSDSSPVALFSGGGLATTSLVASPKSSSGSLKIEAWNGSPLFSDTVMNQITDGGNSFQLTLKSNGSAAFDGNTTLVGDLSVATANGAHALGQSWILGRVSTTGSNAESIVATVGQNPSPTDNVWALADWAKGYDSSVIPDRSDLSVSRSTPNDMPTETGTVTPIVPAPVPSTPTNSENLTATLNSLTGSSFIHPINPSKQEVSSFSASELNTSDDTFGTVSIASKNTEATRIYIDNNDSADPVMINSDKFQNTTGDPRNLQLFYNGSGNVTLNLNNNNEFNGLIYAPSAQLNIIGDGDFNGAFVGKNVNIKMNGIMRLMNPQDLAVQATGPISTQIPVYSAPKTTEFTGYIATTYQELNNPI